MGFAVEVKRDDSCISGYAKVGGKSRRVFQIYHTREGMPSVEFATAYAEQLKELMEKAPYEVK